MAPRKIVRIITRLNIGGPAQQAILLSDRLQPLGWESLLVFGSCDSGEGSMEYLLENRKIRTQPIQALQRAVHPLRDLHALWQIWRILIQEKPEILHTHLAKAGALGRAAGWLYRLSTGKPLRMIHTFHGHVLEGYFSHRTTRWFARIERWLAQRTDVFIAINETVRQDLLKLQIAPLSKIRIIPLGFPLESLLELETPSLPPTFRVGIVGRLVPIKNHELFLKAIHLLHQKRSSVPARFSIIGDGLIKPSLKEMARQLQIEETVDFVGWQRQKESIYQKLDIVCLTSRNEGTPVSLIEALAAARPVIATDVGGVRELLGESRNGMERPIPPGSFELTDRGILIGSEDAQGLAQALDFLFSDPQVGLKLAGAGRAYVQNRFDLKPLVESINRLYRE